MTLEVTSCGPDEVPAALAPLWHYFGTPQTEERLSRLTGVLDPERMHAARVDGRIVGGAGAHTLALTVPGATVPTAGAFGVGVLPTDRRQGVLTALMRTQLDDVHRRGEPLALLWASEDTIYGRFGYGTSSFAGSIHLSRRFVDFAETSEPVGRVRLLSDEDALAAIRDVYDRLLPGLVGAFARSEAWWKLRRLAAAPEDPPLVKAVLELEGRPAGYALYRMRQRIGTGISEGHVEVVEAMGDSPLATREIWRFLLGIDWVDAIRASILPVDHPLFFLLAHPRRLRFCLRDGLWTRLVDVGAALGARGYAAAGELVLDVRDGFCPWNEARYVLAVSDGAAEAERTTRPAELTLDVRELGSAYLGGFSFRRLADAGRVEELVPGAIERADALFRTERAPWCPEIF